jgi:hypothetical protein
MFGVMNKQTEQQVARAKRVGFFIAEHTITPAIPRVTALAGQVTILIGETETEGSNQVQGFGDFRGGSGTRAEMARALQKRLREIGRTARALPRDQYPGVREQFLVPNSLRYQQTIDTGHAFIAAIGPIKAAFVERAYPADFDEQLSDQIAAFEAATQRKELGAQKRRGGTSGLGVTLKKAKEAIDELDAILSVYYRDSNPALFAVWKMAVRVHVPAAIPSSSSSSSPPGGGSGSSAPALASAASLSPNRAGGETDAAIEPRVNGKGGVLVG